MPVFDCLVAIPWQSVIRRVSSLLPASETYRLSLTFLVAELDEVERVLAIARKASNDRVPLIFASSVPDVVG